MKLYGSKHSTCTRKVLVTLAEKGAEAEFVPVELGKGEQKTPAHLARQPFGKVPALDDDGFQLFESRAIMRYLDERLPGPKLTPADPRARARMEQWISIEHSYFSPVAMKLVHQLLFNPRFGRPTDQEVVDKARAEILHPLDVLARRLEEQPYLAGDAFSLAEVTYMPYFEYLYAAKCAEPIAERKPLAAWWEKIAARPSWKKVVSA
jgi:glutathione S-transferase